MPFNSYAYNDRLPDTTDFVAKDASKCFKSCRLRYTSSRSEKLLLWTKIFGAGSECSDIFNEERQINDTKAPSTAVLPTSGFNRGRPRQASFECAELHFGLEILVCSLS